MSGDMVSLFDVVASNDLVHHVQPSQIALPSTQLIDSLRFQASEDAPLADEVDRDAQRRIHQLELDLSFVDAADGSSGPGELNSNSGSPPIDPPWSNDLVENDNLKLLLTCRSENGQVIQLDLQ